MLPAPLRLLFCLAVLRYETCSQSACRGRGSPLTGRDGVKKIRGRLTRHAACGVLRSPLLFLNVAPPPPPHARCRPNRAFFCCCIDGRSGYLPGELYGDLPFFFALSVVYLALGVAWMIVCMLYVKVRACAGSSVRFLDRYMCQPAVAHF